MGKKHKRIKRETLISYLMIAPEMILMLIFIYYFKNILSINDIQTLLNPVAERYFQKTSEPNPV